MADVFETYNMYTSGITASLGDGDSLYVAKNVSVVSQSIAVYSPGSALIFNEGSIYAPADAVQFGRLDTLSTLTNTLGAIIAAQFTVIDLYGAYEISNYGEITSGPYTTAINVQAYQAGTSATIFNAGTISGGTAFYGNTEADKITNVGMINGEIDLGSGNGTFDSSEGVVHGTIKAGSGGDTIIAGTNGGVVVGAGGNDVLYGNTKQASADAASQFVLDGKAGNNRLYGDGAFTTFDSGDNSAGTYNQIFGGKSQMVNVAGYTNNTVSYAGLANDSAKSIYVDLINGDAYKSTATNASGAAQSTFVFEDYLQNVPNVIGSGGSDVIFADNGVDQITGGAGGDTLYAGTGSNSRDTFSYQALTDSPLSNFDIISGFKVGTDKIDLSALNLPIGDVVLSYIGSGVNTVYVETNPTGGFNASTDMILSVTASTSVALSTHDIIGTSVYQQYTVSTLANGNIDYHYTGGTFFNGKSFQSFDNVTNAAGTLLNQTLYDAGGNAIQQTQFNTDGSIYEQAQISRPASGQVLYKFNAGSFFTGKSFSAFDNLVTTGGTLLDQELYNRDGSHTFTVPGSGLTLTAVQNDTFSVTGSNETTRFNATGFKADTFSGYKAGDIFSFSTSIFANYQALQQHVSGTSSAVITTSANDTLTLTNVAASSLTSSMFKFA